MDAHRILSLSEQIIAHLEQATILIDGLGDMPYAMGAQAHSSKMDINDCVKRFERLRAGARAVLVQDQSPAKV